MVENQNFASLDCLIQKKVIKIFVFCIKWSRPSGTNIKTEQKCPVFKWLCQNGRAFENRTQIVPEKLPFKYRIVRILNGHCKAKTSKIRTY
jgi:hypothetical protein